MRTAKLIAVLSGIVATLLSIPFTVLAEQADEQYKSIGAEQLRAFAKAYLEVERIRESYEPQLSSTEDPQKSRRLEEEAISKIGEAITHKGLTLESYSLIVRTANADDALRKKILDLINREKNKS